MRRGCVRATIQVAAGGPAPAILDAIDHSVTTFIDGHPPADDLTLWFSAGWLSESSISQTLTE